MDPDHAALASAAATAIVAAMAREGWDGVKAAVARLWRRGRPGRAAQIETALEESRRELADSDETLAPLTEAELTAEWRARIRRLIGAHPEVAQELAEILGVERRRDAAVSFGTVSHQGFGNVYQAGRDITGLHPERLPDA